MKKMKFWNGGGLDRGEHKGWHVNVCAHSQAKAVHLINELIPGMNMTLNYFRDMYSECWGDDMDGIEPNEPCIYLTEPKGEKRRIKL